MSNIFSIFATQFEVDMNNKVLGLLVVTFILLWLVPLKGMSQGKASQKLSDQEAMAYKLYENGDYKQACDIYIQTTQAHNKEHSSEILRGLVLFFLVDIIGILFFLYIEKRKAYRLLVDKNADCAKRPVMNVGTIDFNDSDYSEGKDRQILEELQRLFEVEKVYLDGDITIESLATMLGTNRNVLSKIVNQHLKRTFPALLNMYRVNEAVRLLTEEKSRNYTIEAVAQMCGYNNRQVFHSAFKKETGLTPMEFRGVAMSKD